MTGRNVLMPAAALLLLACGSAPAGDRAGFASQSALQAGPPLSAPRATHAIIRSGDWLLLIGGCVRDGCEPGPGSATVDMIGTRGETRKVGRLLVQRVQPIAASLPGGRALVLGGWVNGRVDSTSEIFDGATGKSVRGPDLAGPRSSASVAVLADGRVLIAGGFDGANPLASAEIYDPRTGRIQSTGNLVSARSGATATLLRDGRVLIAGGGTGDRSDRVALASAELYDPRTGRFTATGSLAQRRYKHGAVALPDGDVIILGGSDERDYSGKLNSVERYNVRSGRFVPAGRLAEDRFKLADASVLLPSGKIFVAGGNERPELFDPASGTSRLLDMGLGGQWNYLTAALAGDRIFLAGGYSEGSIRVSDRNWTLRL